MPTQVTGTGITFPDTTAQTTAFTPASVSVTNLAYTGTFTGGTGVVNIGSGQLYKDASGNVAVGTTTTRGKFNVANDAFTPGAATWDTTAAINASGTSGGGLTLVDSTAGYAFWTTNTGTTLNIGQGSTTGTPTVLASVDATAGLTVSGNLTTSGTGRRILGDFSNATLTSRTIFQTTTTNGNTAIRAIPNGTSVLASWGVHNNSDPTNSGLLSISIADTVASITCAQVGTGTTLPLVVNVGGTEQARYDTSGNYYFNSGYGSAAKAYGVRAWVNFDATVSGTWAGGASTVTRNNGTTLCTVTTTTAHGLITGNQVYALTGVAAGTYTVTVTDSTHFTFNTVATTSLAAVTITFAVLTVRGSGNVSSIADVATGRFIVNLMTAMPDTNYAVLGTSGNTGSSGGTIISTPDGDSLTTTSFSFEAFGNDGAATNRAYNYAAVIR